MNEPISICAVCQKINHPENSQYCVHANLKIKEELNLVDQQVISAIKNSTFRFSHSYCDFHMIQMYRELGYDENELKLIYDKFKNNPSCLITDDKLRHAYMLGLFTKEMIDDYEKNQNNLKEEMVVRFKKLSGII